jgi:hypothetical protein
MQNRFKVSPNIRFSMFLESLKPFFFHKYNMIKEIPRTCEGHLANSTKKEHVPLSPLISTTYKGTNLAGKLDLNHPETLIKRSRCLVLPTQPLGHHAQSVSEERKGNRSPRTIQITPSFSPRPLPCRFLSMWGHRPRAAADRRCCLHATASFCASTPAHRSPPAGEIALSRRRVVRARLSANVVKEGHVDSRPPMRVFWRGEHGPQPAPVRSKASCWRKPCRSATSMWVRLI